MRILIALAMVLCCCAPMPPAGDAGRSDARSSDAGAHPLVGTWVRSHPWTYAADDAGVLRVASAVRLTFSADGSFTSRVVTAVEDCTRADETGRGRWRIVGADGLAFDSFACSALDMPCPRALDVPRCSGHEASRIGSAGVRFGVRGDTLTFYDQALNRVEFTRSLTE